MNILVDYILMKKRVLYLLSFFIDVRSSYISENQALVSNLVIKRFQQFLLWGRFEKGRIDNKKQELW